MSPSSSKSIPPPSSSSSSSSSICCCSRYFRRNPPNPPAKNNGMDAIEIKVNGQPHLRVPHVALRPNSLSVITNAENERGIDTGRSEVYETARTSRHTTTDGKLIPMTELMRMVRIEEGLEVTPRPLQPNGTSSTTPSQHLQQSKPPTCPPLKIQMLNSSPKKARRAIFNEEGDITTRSCTTRGNKSKKEEEQYKNNEEMVVYTIPIDHRRASTESLEVSTVILPQFASPPPRPSSLSRRIAATPQLITTFVAVTYAFLTTFFTTFTNLFSK